MKRTFLVMSLCLVTGLSFAQKKAVKEAKSAGKTAEARELIKPALTNPETMNDSETWKVAGDIEYKSFDYEKTQEQLKDIPGNKGANYDEMYQSLYNMWNPYLKADELGQIPDEKGKVKNKVRKDVMKNLKDSYPYYINGGIYYNEKKDYKKAADFFERYWEMPSLPIFKGDANLFNTKDTVFQTIKYYATISAIQDKDHPRSIRLLKKMIAEPYVSNSTYKESDPYELLASEYQMTDDSIAYVSTLKDGANKFPTNQYFTPNLINQYIKAGNTNEAIAFLDQAIKNDKNNSCELNSVKGSLFTEQKSYEEAEKAFKAAFDADANCTRALEGIGVLYIFQAQDLKEQSGQLTNNRAKQVEIDKQTTAFYEKAVPYLEKYRAALKAKDADSHDMRLILLKLQNVYYNLKKDPEFNAIDEELKMYN